MTDIAIKIENLSKQYRLGTVGTGTISHDLNRWWARVRGKEDPFLKIGEQNDRSVKGGSEYVWALKDINLDVKKGEVLGIIGKNGAGKSTLLKLLSKVTGPTTGKIMAKGRIGALLEVGTGFHPELTGRENIFLNGAILGMTKAEIRSKIDEIVDFSGCARYVDTPVKRYSSGMKVRLAFAVAAFLEPEIMIVDEVLAVGDAEFQKKAIGKMQDVSQGEGRTVLFVSHNMASIQNLCSSVAIMEKGTISFQGNVADGIRKYLSSDLMSNDISLAERRDRRKGNVFRITEMYFTDENENQLTTLLSGKSVSLKVIYSLKEDINFRSMKLVFKDLNGVVRILCNSALVREENKFHFRKGSGVILFDFPKWSLPAGQYSVDIYAWSDVELIDQLEDAITINSENGDFYGFGRIPNNDAGVYTEYSVTY